MARVGFVGDLEGVLSPDLPAAMIRYVHFLADLSLYFGVGLGTTFGMGQTVKVEPKRQSPFIVSDSGTSVHLPLSMPLSMPLDPDGRFRYASVARLKDVDIQL